MKKTIDEYNKDIVEGKEMSARFKKMLEKEKKAARKRIIERGIIHFRADKEFMKALHEAAEELKTAPGTLCRSIVWDYLSKRNSGKISESPSDLYNLVDELMSGQNAIRKELKEIRSHLQI